MESGDAWTSWLPWMGEYIIQRHNFSCLTCIRVLHCILRWRQSKMAAASRSKCMPGRLRAESRDSFRRPSTLRSRRRGATERLPLERERRISEWSLSIDFVCSRLKKCSTNRRTESRPNEKHRLRPNDNDEMPQDNWCHLNRNNNNNSTHFNIIRIIICAVEQSYLLTWYFAQNVFI